MWRFHDFNDFNIKYLGLGNYSQFQRLFYLTLKAIWTSVFPNGFQRQHKFCKVVSVFFSLLPSSQSPIPPFFSYFADDLRRNNLAYERLQPSQIEINEVNRHFDYYLITVLKYKQQQTKLKFYVRSISVWAFFKVPHSP